MSDLVRRAKRRILRHVRSPADRAHDETGTCSVCGEKTRFVFNSWSIDRSLLRAWGDPAAEHPYLRRESMFCRSCSSSLRVRLLAASLLGVLGDPGPSIRGALDSDSFTCLDIAEVNELGSTGSMHSVLESHPRLTASEYRGPETLGAMDDSGRRNEDFTALSYPDASFDVVLHSDTLEHVPDFHSALREARRVLRPGGLHVFTVPVLSSRARTIQRARLRDDGGVEYLQPPLHHGRGAGPYSLLPNRGDFLEFTSFGADLGEIVERAGFQVTIDEHHADDAGTGAGWVVVARAS